MVCQWGSGSTLVSILLSAFKPGIGLDFFPFLPLCGQSLFDFNSKNYVLTWQATFCLSTDENGTPLLKEIG